MTDHTAFLDYHRLQHADSYKSGVLQPEKHWRLVSNAPQYAAQAGIDPRYIWEDPTHILGQLEVDWVTEYPSHSRNNVAGLLYLGDYKPPAIMRINYIAGKFLRNYLQPKVMSAQALQKWMFREDESPYEKVLVLHSIPAAPAESLRQMLDGIITERFGLGLQTVLAVDSVHPTQFDKGNVVRGQALQLVKDYFWRVP